MRGTFIALSIALSVATPAFAQLKPEVQTGSLIPVKPQGLDPKDAGVVRKHGRPRDGLQITSGRTCSPTPMNGRHFSLLAVQ